MLYVGNTIVIKALKRQKFFSISDHISRHELPIDWTLYMHWLDLKFSVSCRAKWNSFESFNREQFYALYVTKYAWDTFWGELFCQKMLVIPVDETNIRNIFVYF